MDGRRATVKRLLAAGALIGLVGGLASQPVLDSAGAGSDIVWLVRFSMLFPAALFIAWWLIGPGLSLDRGEAPAEPAATDADDVTRRVAAIEHTFVDQAAPAARRSARSADREWYRASVRRSSAADGVESNAAFWGLGGRSRIARDVDADSLDDSARG